MGSETPLRNFRKNLCPQISACGGPLLVQMLRASVANFGGDIESTAWRGGEGERFIDKGEEKSCSTEEDVDAE